MVKFLFLIEINKKVSERYCDKFGLYLTGCLNQYMGDCELEEQYIKETGDIGLKMFADSIDYFEDDHYIFPTNQSKEIAILFSKRPTKIQIKILKERTQKFIDNFDNKLKVYGFFVLKEKSNYIKTKV